MSLFHRQLLLSFLLLLAAVTATYAQIETGYRTPIITDRNKDIYKGLVDSLRATTTIFILQDRDKPYINIYQKAIATVWTISPFKVMLREDARQYESRGGYSFFRFRAKVLWDTLKGSAANSSGAMRTGRYRNIDLAQIRMGYVLSVPAYKSGKAGDENTIAAFCLCPDQQTSTIATPPGFSIHNKNDLEDLLYADLVYSQWRPGYIKAFLKTINDRLLAKETYRTYDELTNSDQLAMLKTDTLYIPKYVNTRLNIIDGNRKDVDKDENSVKDAYPYPVKYISDETLDVMLQYRSTPFYCLQYVRSGTEKFVSVFEGASGKLIYSNYSTTSYNFKDKDLKMLAKAVR